VTADHRGDYARATAHADEALARFRALGDQTRAGSSLNNLGLAAYYRGDYERARALHEEALAMRREAGDRNGIAMSLSNLGLVAYAQGDYERASALQQDALDMRRVLSGKNGLAHCLENLALVAAATRDPERAVRLFAAAAALRTRIGSALRPADQEFNRLQLDEIRAQVGEAPYAAAWEEGQAMPLEAAIAYALERSRSAPIGAPRPAPGVEWPTPVQD
jgi:tetratricopeptide (TPR) repeat protein